MANATTIDLPEADAPETAPTKQVVHVPISKAKTTLEVSIEDIPAEDWAEVILQGLKVVLNRGASKVTKAAHKGDVEAMKTDALRVANKQLEMLYAGEIKKSAPGKASTKTPYKVRLEAMRLAKVFVNEELKRQGLKPAHYETKDKTAMAAAYLETEAAKTTWARAEKNVADREAPVASDEVTSLFKTLKVSDKLVKKAADKAAKDKAGKPMSKTQAGKVKARTKGEPSHATH